jgi:hypothetical protein
MMRSVDGRTQNPVLTNWAIKKPALKFKSAGFVG